MTAESVQNYITSMQHTDSLLSTGYHGYPGMSDYDHYLAACSTLPVMPFHPHHHGYYQPHYLPAPSYNQAASCQQAATSKPHHPLTSRLQQLTTHMPARHGQHIISSWMDDLREPDFSSQLSTTSPQGDHPTPPPVSLATQACTSSQPCPASLPVPSPAVEQAAPTVGLWDTTDSQQPTPSTVQQEAEQNFTTLTPVSSGHLTTIALHPLLSITPGTQLAPQPASQDGTSLTPAQAPASVLSACLHQSTTPLKLPSPPTRRQTTRQKPYRRGVKRATAKPREELLCSHCDTIMPSKQEMQAHIILHDLRPHTCPIPGCDKRFNQLQVLAVHLRTHSGHRPYHCTYNCGKSFTDVSTKVKHERTHSGVKPYVCHLCLRSFSQSGNLNRHLTKVHHINM